MKAMILAAGVGERMRPLTDHTPKPLLRVGGIPLIEYHLRNLAKAGFQELVINVAHLGQQIVDYCEDGSRWDVSITYSREESPLETAGGILQALPLLGNAPFLIVNGDVWIGDVFAAFTRRDLREHETARLLLLNNPPQHPKGDFLLDQDGWVRERPQEATGLTYAGVGIYSPEFFANLSPGKVPLRPLMNEAIVHSRLGGELHDVEWEDVGTPERLITLDTRITEYNNH